MFSPTYLSEFTNVHFELQGSLPLFRERYFSAQAGTVTIKGIINQTALLEPKGGGACRISSSKRDDRNDRRIAYPIISLTDKSELLRLLTPARFEKGAVPELRYGAALDGRQYMFKQAQSGRREFDLWDGPELRKFVHQESGYLVGDLKILIAVPLLLVLLFPWLNNQTIMVRK